MTRTRPPARRTPDPPSDEASAPPVPVLEATLVPDVPFYEATPVLADDPSEEEEPSLWWRHNQKFIFLVFILVIVALAVIVGALVGSQNNNDGDENNESDAVGIRGGSDGDFETPSPMSSMDSMEPSSHSPAIPTASPSSPSRKPRLRPSASPTAPPSKEPTSEPSASPSTKPTIQPSTSPSEQPTHESSSAPSVRPSNPPTHKPSIFPSEQPTPLMWKQVGQIITGEAAGDGSGVTVDLSEDGMTLAIGAWGNDDNGIDSGGVMVYHREGNGSSWKQLGRAMNGGAVGDRFGNTISLSGDGNTIAVGAYSNNDNGEDSGEVKVYSWDEATLNYEQLGLSINGEATGDYSGRSIALSKDGMTLAIGAPRNDDNGNNSGHVEVYGVEADGPIWKQIGESINGKAAGDRLGIYVALSSEETSSQLEPHLIVTRLARRKFTNGTQLFRITNKLVKT